MLPQQQQVNKSEHLKPGDPSFIVLAVDKLSSSFDGNSQPERGGSLSKRRSKGELCATGATPTSYITSNGRILSMLRKDSPKSVALANLSKLSPARAEAKEMADLEERVTSGLVASSTESALSSSE